MERRCMVPVLLLLLVLVPQEVVGEDEGRMCESQSQKFKGMCVSYRNCSNVCKEEGFEGGKCRGFRRRCFCVKPCGEGEQPPPGDSLG